MRIVSSPLLLLAPKRRQSHPSGEEEMNGDAARGASSGNASAWGTSAEIDVKGKYSGLGKPADDEM